MLEPFAADPDPAFYVPRPASERAIEAVHSSLEHGSDRIVVLYGPPGIGKSVVLDQVSLRVRHPTVCLRMDHAGLSPEDICAWLARELESQAIHAGRPRSWSERMRDAFTLKHADRRDAGAELVQQVEQLRRIGSRVFALIDEADDASAAQLRGLSDVSRQCGGGLRLCVATSHEEALEGLDSDAEVIRYVSPLSEAETRAYIDTRLQRAHAGTALRSRLDPKRLQRLHRFSGGNPRRLHAELSLIRIELDTQGETATEQAEPSQAPTIPMDAARAEPAVRAEPQKPSPERPIEPPPQAAAPHSASRTKEPAQEPPRIPGPVQSETLTPTLRPPPPLSLKRTVQLDEAASPSRSGRPARPVAGAQSVASIQPSPSSPTKDARAPKDAHAPERPATDRSAIIEKLKPLAWAGAAVVIAGTGWWLFTASPDSAKTPRAPTTPTDSIARVEIPSGNASTAAADAPLPIPVNINADPWASIWIDGEPVGETPLGDVPLAPGDHVFRAELPSGRVIERTIRIDQSRRWVYFE